MNPGELRNRIEIQKYTRDGDNVNEAGEEIKTWQLYKRPWAKFCNSSVKDQVKAGKDASSIVYKIVIWYSKNININTTMRVVYKGKIYSIDHVVNYKEQNIETHLYCTLIEEGVYNE